MVRAQPRQLGEGRQRDVICDMLFDIGGHPLLLPACKTAGAGRRPTGGVPVDPNPLMGARVAAAPPARRQGGSKLIRTSSWVSMMPRASAYCRCIEPGFSACDWSFRA